MQSRCGLNPELWESRGGNFPLLQWNKKGFHFCKRLHFQEIYSSLHRNKIENYFFLQKYLFILALFLTI